MLFTLNLSQPRFTNEPCRRLWALLGRCRNSRSRGGFLRSLGGNLLHGLLCSLHRRFLGSLIGGGWLLGLGRLLRLRPFRRPPLLQCSDDCGLASGAELPLRLGNLRRDRRRRRRLLLSFRPPFPLRFGNPGTASGAHLPPFAFWNLRRSGGRRGSEIGRA